MSARPKVAVAIKSCHKHAARRAAQLATWLPQLECDYFFLIGSPTPVQGGAVIADSIACDVSDAFDSIAPKIDCACRYAMDENITNLLVCDDDTYIAASRLLKSNFARLDYVGWVRPNGDIANGFVPYMQGSAYWLSARAMERVIRSGEMHNNIIDDGAVGRALYGKVPFTHDDRYWPGPIPDRFPQANNVIISTHKVAPAIMPDIHKRWMAGLKPAA
jgi:hypothetical protein